MNPFNPNNKFMQLLSQVIDALGTNILLVLTSIPVMTIGASLTAAHDVVRRQQRGEGHLTRAYFRAFRRNFVQASQIWLVFLVAGGLLAASWLYAPASLAVLVLQIFVALILVVGFEWAFYLQSRFANPTALTLRNAWIFAVSHIGITVLLIAFDAAFLAIIIAAWFYWPQSEFLILLLGYGSLLHAHLPLLEYAMRQYLPHDKREEDQ